MDKKESFLVCRRFHWWHSCHVSRCLLMWRKFFQWHSDLCLLYQNPCLFPLFTLSTFQSFLAIVAWAINKTSRSWTSQNLKKYIPKLQAMMVKLEVATHVLKWKKNLYIYINKDGNPSTKSTRHVDTNVNTWKKNQDHQNSNNELEDVMLKKHFMPQIS